MTVLPRHGRLAIDGMVWLLLTVILSFIFTRAVTVSAQTATANPPPEPSNKPMVQTKLSQSDIVPGQAVTLQITVLVPTWLTQPLALPSLDRPNLSVTLPEKSTVSTSQTINGATWSGVIREYQLVPLTPGTFQLPPTTLEVHYRNPDGNGDLIAQVPLNAEVLTASAPKGAETLKPYIAARQLTLEQRIEGDPQSLQPGDSFSRTVIATIEGSTVMFLPQMLGTTTPSGLAAYADTPSAEDGGTGNGNRGTRVEKVTYVAESPTRGTLPGITLRWYDLDDGSIQTSTLDAIDVRVKGAPITRPRSPEAWLITLALVGGLGWLAWRYLPPFITRIRKRLIKRQQADGTAQVRQLQSAIKQRNYSAALAAATSLHNDTDYIRSEIPSALLALGRAQYGNTPASASTAPLWQRLELATDAFAARRRSRKDRQALPPMNPS
ncbi:BatD family protein [Microbulbifer salipaludis]|uniref:BatD family protein n=1 Tax=Microbulbifer salipaludis TaxID=187980 RepID=A0ABS3E9R9_9GAMM|nr:BatD family protein [Microbulbifer salipaludis]MBN8432066.1 BatD family protein [Microbulbifer salipaludis]